MLLLCMIVLSCYQASFCIANSIDWREDRCANFTLLQICDLEQRALHFPCSDNFISKYCKERLLSSIDPHDFILTVGAGIEELEEKFTEKQFRVASAHLQLDSARTNVVSLRDVTIYVEDHRSWLEASYSQHWKRPSETEYKNKLATALDIAALQRDTRISLNHAYRRAFAWARRQRYTVLHEHVMVLTTGSDAGTVYEFQYSTPGGPHTPLWVSIITGQIIQLE